MDILKSGWLAMAPEMLRKCNSKLHFSVSLIALKSQVFGFHSKRQGLLSFDMPALRNWAIFPKR